MAIPASRIVNLNRIYPGLQKYPSQEILGKKAGDAVCRHLIANICKATGRLAFIERWPTLKQVKRARQNTLKKFFHQHNVRFSHILERRLKAIREAEPLTLDEAVIGHLDYRRWSWLISYG